MKLTLTLDDKQLISFAKLVETNLDSISLQVKALGEGLKTSILTPEKERKIKVYMADLGLQHAICMEVIEQIYKAVPQRFKNIKTEEPVEKGKLI